MDAGDSSNLVLYALVAGGLLLVGGLSAACVCRRRRRRGKNLALLQAAAVDKEASQASAALSGKGGGRGFAPPAGPSPKSGPRRSMAYMSAVSRRIRESLDEGRLRLDDLDEESSDEGEEYGDGAVRGTGHVTRVDLRALEPLAAASARLRPGTSARVPADPRRQMARSTKL